MSASVVWQFTWQLVQGVHMAIGTGRAQKLCQVDQGVIIYTLQKPMTSLHSAPTVTNAASQRALVGTHCYPSVVLQVCPTRTPARDGSNEHICGRCVHVEEFMPSDRALG